VANGQATFDAGVGARLVDQLVRSNGSNGGEQPSLEDRFPQLTPREASTLRLIADGLSNPEIATRQFVSVSTVKTHVNSIFAKLQVRDRAKAIALVRSR
jgi:DNA-binding NarL/FixJ family response regulator